MTIEEKLAVAVAALQKYADRDQWTQNIFRGVPECENGCVFAFTALMQVGVEQPRKYESEDMFQKRFVGPDEKQT